MDVFVFENLLSSVAHLLKAVRCLWEQRRSRVAMLARNAGGGCRPYFYLSISVIGACSISHVTVSTRDRPSPARFSLIPAVAWRLNWTHANLHAAEQLMNDVPTPLRGRICIHVRCLKF